MHISQSPQGLEEPDAPPRDPLAPLWLAATTRLRCAAVTRAVENGDSGWFTLDRTPWPALVQRAAQQWQERSSAVEPPAPWGSWAREVPERLARLETALAAMSADQALRARLDVTQLALLLSADPGPGWAWLDRRGRSTSALALPSERQQSSDLLAMLDQASGVPAAAPAIAPVSASPAADAAGGASPTSAAEAADPDRAIPGSAGLAAAVLQAFLDGVFSDHAQDPLRVDARALTRLDLAAVREVFRASPGSPALAEWDARVTMLRRLGDLLERWASAQTGLAARPSLLLDLMRTWPDPSDASALLQWLCSHWAPIWPGGPDTNAPSLGRVLGLPAGDVRGHRWAGAAAPERVDPPTGGWVPLHHRCLQVLLGLRPLLRDAGIELSGMEALTTGGDLQSARVFLDAGVLVPRQPADLARTWTVHDEMVIEWRILGVQLMDELAQDVRVSLNLQPGALSTLDLARTLGADTSLASSAPVVKVRADGIHF